MLFWTSQRYIAYLLLKKTQDSCNTNQQYIKAFDFLYLCLVNKYKKLTNSKILQVVPKEDFRRNIQDIMQNKEKNNISLTNQDVIVQSTNRLFKVWYLKVKKEKVISTINPFETRHSLRGNKEWNYQFLFM